MMIKFSFDTEELLEEDILTKTNEELSIVLFNDDHNSFDWVIECLMTVCGHDLLQAEQCTYLVHYAGKCSVKSGTFKKLKPLCEALLEKGLTAKIL